MATLQTSGSQVFSTSPGKRASQAGEQTAADRANAAASLASAYVGRRVANRPVDAPSGTLAGSALLTAPVAAPAVAPAAAPADLDTGTIRTVLAGLEPVDHSTSFADETTQQLPLLSAAAPAVTLPAGRRRATKHSGRRGPLFRGLPSAPLLLGVAALAVSAGGAIAVGDTQITPAAQSGTAQASALSGTGGIGTAGRSTTVSRDSARSTLDAATTLGTVDPVVEAAKERSGSLKNLAGKVEKYAAVIAENQWQVPLDSYRLTARFGQYGLWASYHTGLDFAAPSGTPIHAIANGVVTSAGYDGSYGNKTVVTLDDGTELWYCHQTAFAVSVGDTVRGGETIGYVGSTGNVTGPHVHIEVRPGGGDPVDPYPAFVEHGVTP